MKELRGKTKLLTNYYKYHRDIPRLFMFPLVLRLNSYHDAKRQIEYKKITKIIAEEERMEQGLPREEPQKSTKTIRNYERLLKKLNFENF